MIICNSVDPTNYAGKICKYEMFIFVYWYLFLSRKYGFTSGELKEMILIKCPAIFYMAKKRRKVF